MTFRIERTASGRAVVVLHVSGRIDRENVETLREAIAQETGRVALDLTEVRLVDREAVKFLAISEANGVELRNCAAYIHEWIAREKEVGRE
jgi:anti-anti-sigma regulatory factor